jgi:hypothetical protein
VSPPSADCPNGARTVCVVPTPCGITENRGMSRRLTYDSAVPVILSALTYFLEPDDTLGYQDNFAAHADRGDLIAVAIYLDM